MTNARPRDLMTSTEAAGYLGVHPKTLQLWAQKGLVAFYWSAGGTRRMYAQADLDQIMTRVESGAAS